MWFNFIKNFVCASGLFARNFRILTLMYGPSYQRVSLQIIVGSLTSPLWSFGLTHLVASFRDCARAGGSALSPTLRLLRTWESFQRQSLVLCTTFGVHTKGWPLSLHAPFIMPLLHQTKLGSTVSIVSLQCCFESRTCSRCLGTWLLWSSLDSEMPKSSLSAPASFAAYRRHHMPRGKVRKRQPAFALLSFGYFRVVRHRTLFSKACGQFFSFCSA